MTNQAEQTVRYENLAAGDYFSLVRPTPLGGLFRQTYRVTAVLDNGTRVSAPIGRDEARLLRSLPPRLDETPAPEPARPRRGRAKQPAAGLPAGPADPPAPAETPDQQAPSREEPDPTGRRPQRRRRERKG